MNVQACGICGTDAHVYRGEFPVAFPLIAGHELAGVVEELGPGVSNVRQDDHVAVDPNIPCGACRPCRRGRPHLCQNFTAIGLTLDGGFATHCAVPARQLLKLPKEMPFSVAAMTEPVACCLHGIERAQIRPGDLVVLIGAGMIGLVLLQLALLRGAAIAIVSELKEDKRELAQALGATVVDPAEENLQEVVERYSEGEGADVVIDCAGGAATAQQAAELVGWGGRVLLFGVAPQEARLSLSPFDIYRREITITGSFTNPFTTADAVAMLASGRVQVRDLISHMLPLEELIQGIELLESGKATKVLVEPNP